MSKTVYAHIGYNNAITWILMALFPISFMIVFYGVSFVLLYLMQSEPVPIDNYLPIINDFVLTYFPFVALIAIVWMGISYRYGDRMMLGFAGARPVNTKSEKERKIKLFVETSAIAAGLPTPKVYIIEDESLNAFATGHSPKTASVALTTGIIEKLDHLELQAVVAHEMAHIGNHDVRLNMLIITGLGVFGFAAEFIFRVVLRAGGGKGSGKKGGQIIVLLFAFAITCWIFNVFIAPFIHMAISRTREYAADATAALITRNPKALADALAKISQDPFVENLDGSPLMTVACIYPPLKKFKGRGTHPPIKDRVKRLHEMAGLGAAQTYNVS